jgi:polyisoprenoid-binding protein YceI
MFNSDELVLSKFVLIAQVKSIKSGKESMDENTYESMNADDYPTINFELTKIKNMDKDSVYSLMTMGKLTINNVTKEIPINVKIKKLGSKASIEGSKTFKMTDYGIDPPSMFLGTINTGNEITIKFNLKLTSNKEE